MDTDGHRLKTKKLRIRVYLCSSVVSFLTFMQLADGGGYFFRVHFMHFHPATDVFQERYRQFTAQMFTELLEPVQDVQMTFGVVVQQFVREQFETQFFQKVKNAVRGFFVQ